MFLFNLFSKIIKQNRKRLLDFFYVFLYSLERLQEDDVVAGRFLVVLRRISREDKGAAGAVFLDLL